MREITDDLTDAGRELLQHIAEHKAHVMHVTDDDGVPTFSYTVGLWHHFEQPEVIVFGLAVEAAEELLQRVVDAAAEGARFAHGEKHEGLLVGFAARFLAVPDEAARAHLGAATWAYQGAAYRCVQLVWPDKEKRWPWQEGVRQGFRDVQPLLGPHE
ncbi:MAG: DUF4262 domain-containing protein [Planctomycetota bacterium]